MKAISSGLKTLLNSNQALLSCNLYTITLANGTVLRYTDAPQDILIGTGTGLTAQQNAANAAALADIAAGGTDFYAEIGPASGSLLWNNGGVGYGGGTVVASTAVAYASVTKTLTACCALTAFGGTISATNYKLLCMTAGRDLMQGQHCSTAGTETVHSCAITPHGPGPLSGVLYNAYNPAHDGEFSYDSGGWQYLGDTVLGWTLDNATALANVYIAQFSLTAGTLACTSPMPAGGARSTGNVLRKIAQQICTGTGGGAAMKAHQQDTSFVPVVATNVNNGSSPGVFTSPAPVNEPMHYKSGLWIRDLNGDYYMAGSAGTVVWIKSDFSMYGMVVRNGGNIDGALSMQTMWKIQAAFETGGNTYRAAVEGSTTPLMSRGQIKLELGLQAGSLEVDMAYTQNTLILGMTPGAFANAGGLDYATVQIDKLITDDFDDTSNGVVNLWTGVVSDVKVDGGKVAMTVSAQTVYLQSAFPRNYALPHCNHALFDAGCTLSKASYAVNDAVDSATSTTVTAASLTQASGYFAQGYIVFTSGALNGLQRFVKSFASGVLTLLYPMPSNPAPGDTFTVYPGCDKTQNTCSTKFSNLAHFRGYPYVPTPEVLELGQAGAGPADTSGSGAGITGTGRGVGGQTANFKQQ